MGTGDDDGPAGGRRHDALRAEAPHGDLTATSILVTFKGAIGALSVTRTSQATAAMPWSARGPAVRPAAAIRSAKPSRAPSAAFHDPGADAQSESWRRTVTPGPRSLSSSW